MARGYPDFEGGKAGLYSIADWTAKEATDKNFFSSALSKTYGQVDEESYTVPAGKTLYITQFYCYAIASNVADGDNNQICGASLYRSNPAPQSTYAHLAGNGGGAVALPKPAVFTAGETMIMAVASYANHTCNIGVGASGYEL